MELHFLKAADGAPLTKTFTKKPDGQIHKTSYPPHLFKVSSQPIEINSTDELEKAIRISANEGFALQKGELDAVLVDESRANHTLKDKATQWILFDIDGLPNIASVESFIADVLPEPFHQASYVVQYSASHGIVDKGLSAHLFFLLDGEVEPKVLKDWLRLLNLQVPLLKEALTLQQGNKSALKWPLDVTVAGNDKYVYIAPPVCVGFEDPMNGSRIQRIAKPNDKVKYSFDIPSKEKIRTLERAKIRALREHENLPKLNLRTHKIGSFDVLKNADPVEVTDWWFANGYYHLNLNGGDSGAYWVNPKRPKYIHSFKDEPSRILKDVAPAFWDEIKENCNVDEMLLFRDEITDKFYAGTYDPIEDEIVGELRVITRGNIKDWVNYTFDAAVPDPIEQYSLIFDPSTTKILDKKRRIVNLFKPSDYMRLEPDTNATVPPTIKKILEHVVNYDLDTYYWTLNWLSYIFQTRNKSRVALVLHGTKGTGKGLLFNKILRPLLGDKTTISIQQRDIASDQYNEYLRESLMIMLDEAENNRWLRDKLFHWVTEDRLRIRVAYSGGEGLKNYSNFIIASNKPDAAPIESNDRRFTVAPRQEHPIQLTNHEIDVVIDEELSEFARYLLAYEVNTELATTPLHTAAKAVMAYAARDSITMFIDAVKSGDILYFLNLLQSGDPDMSAEAAIKRWASNVNLGTSSISIKELLAVYRFSSGNSIAVAKFMALLAKRGMLDIDYVEINDLATRGARVEWTAPAKDLANYKQLLGGVRAAAIDGAERTVLKLGDD